MAKTVAILYIKAGNRKHGVALAMHHRVCGMCAKVYDRAMTTLFSPITGPWKLCPLQYAMQKVKTL